MFRISKSRGMAIYIYIYVYECMQTYRRVRMAHLPCLATNTRTYFPWKSAAMDMNGAELQEPSQSHKLLHLVRHAQGIHNVEMEKNREAILSPKLLDAELSQKGWQQVSEKRRQVNENGLLERVELVITSPMLRAMQTAVGIFGEEGHVDTSNEHPKAVGDAENRNDNSELSTIKCPPIIAVELCRERMGVHPCDKRGSIKKYRSLFPAIDFSLIESEDDILWQPNRREELEQVSARGLQFLKWLWMRPEQEIAIVSHGIFLQQTLLAFEDKTYDTSELKRLRFANCELRPLGLDKRVMGTNSLKNYHPGQISRELDFLTDPSKETVLAEEMSS